MSITTTENRVRRNREELIRIGHMGRDRRAKYETLFKGFFESLLPPEQLDLDEWCDKYFYLPSESASEHGLFRTDRFPFLRKIMKKVSPSSPCREIGTMKGAQLGFTTILNAWSLYIADQALGPSMFVQPTGDAIIEYSEQKLQPSIDACPQVATKLGDKRPKHLSSTKKRKYFPGGYIALASANSAPSLRSKSIRNLMLDEEDGCSNDVQGEGSSIQLAIRRTANFSDRKIVRISTPVLKETSSIEPFCMRGTAERFLVPCPECNPELEKYGTYFAIEWEHIKYDNNDYRTAKCACPGCGSLIDESKKTWMLENAFWYRYNPTAINGMENDERRQSLLVEIEKLGYHDMAPENLDYLENSSIPDNQEEVCTFLISSLYSPLGFYSWQQAVKDWLEATERNDHSLMKTFINTVLGQTFSNLEDKIPAKGLASRREIYSQYGDFDVPQDALVVCMGIDVQQDRLECQIVAFGEKREEWVMDYKVFYGDTTIIGDHEYKYKNQLTCWGQLLEFQGTQYKHESGHMLPIECTLIDARYRSPYVFRFCLENMTRKIYAVQGHTGWGKGEIERPLKKNKYGVMVFKAFQDEIKNTFYRQLRNDLPGPHYVHFPRHVELPKGYFKGLVLEELKVKQQKGDDVYYWENPPGGRNEPLDTHNYAYCAFLALRLSLPTRKAILAKSPKAPKKYGEKDLTKQQQPDLTPRKRKIIKKREG